jgi:RimJ/RimL family protein N-acetyltransferase
MTILVNDRIQLSELRASDKSALVEHLNDPGIFENTLRIPFPYTDTHADDWLALVSKMTAEHGRPFHWAIRNTDDALIGGCDFQDLVPSHRAEIGYWLARPFWGQGIMTAVVKRICPHVFEEFRLTKITAHVFTCNPASARVLEKCGFEKEGLLRRHFLKEGKFLDAWPYALLK